MLIDPDTVPEVLSRVRDEDFAEKKYRLIFQAIQARFRAGQALTRFWSGRLWAAAWTAHGPRFCRA